MQRLRKPLAAVGFGVRSSATQADSVVPTVTSGSGAPSSTEPDGSVYMRTDASDGDDALYSMISSSWVALKGQTA